LREVAVFLLAVQLAQMPQRAVEHIVEHRRRRIGGPPEAVDNTHVAARVI
jgi:hypothetical protein